MRAVLFAAAVGAASAAPSGKRLLDFGPLGGGRRWVSEEDVITLAHRAECKSHRRHEVGQPGNGSFIDVTDNLDADVLSAKVRKLRLKAATPSSPTHQEFVKTAIGHLNTAQYQADIEHLASYHNRYYTQKDAADAVQWLAEQYRASIPASRKNDVTIQEFQHSWTQPSLIVRVKGSSASDEVVVVGGHIDSIAGILSTSRAPGADDDASGSAGVLQAFRALMASGFVPSRTVEFQAYAAEEVGLRGSQDIAQKYAQDDVNVVGMLQLDMTGWDNGNPRVGVITDYTDSTQNDFIRELTRTYLTIPPADGRCGYGCSDHASFDRYGYPASFAFEAPFGEHNPHIHTAQDTIDKMNMTHATEFAKLAVGFAAELGCDAAKKSCN
eukprot:TRINITY_DN418_c0_g1_i1.p1 TRINITY_DN418_c0_g1~~TRINITY_DN418_c0_g1_i1.p1  ORF type:complete len:403 (+),score=150.79 TRINITY_DN418_c0_g1_i1:62-1210(+)